MKQHSDSLTNEEVIVMRIINAYALKKKAFTLEEEPGLIGIDVVSVEDINNAPTVPIPDYKAGYKQAIIDGLSNSSRPHGKWIKTAIYGQFCYECDQCHIHTDYKTNFCSNCGEDMRE